MKHIAVIVALVVTGAFAQAKSRISPTAWGCSMGFNGYAKGFKVIIGTYQYKGHGTLDCVSASGERVSLPITVSMRAAPLSPTISLSRMELRGVAANISLLNTYPEAILGTYGVVQGSVALVGGVGAMTAVHAELPSVTLNLSLQLARGFGLNLGINRMVIALDESRLN